VLEGKKNNTAAAFAQRSGMHLFPFQAKYPNFDYITSPDSFFSNVKEEYNDYDDSGFFRKTPEEGFYIYEIRTGNRSFTGLVACVDIRDYLDGHIRRHEDTLAAKEQRQMQLLMHRNAMVKPVLLFHQPLVSLSEFLERFKDDSSLLTTHFETPDESHTLWKVTGERDVKYLQNQFFQHIPDAYIADGHHRSSMAALLYERRKGKPDQHKFGRLLCAFFPESDLEILDYNRIVDAFGELSVARFMGHLSQVVDIEVLSAPAKPSEQHQMTMLINREWFSLRWKAHILQNWPERVILDASLLDRYVIREIFGIEDVRNDQRLKYMEGSKGLDEFRNTVNKSDQRVGFCLSPVNVEGLKEVADSGKVMPPKSTWFEPRMRNGLIVYEI
jgi:uncharacterized protein (DUF1015 family)